MKQTYALLAMLIEIKKCISLNISVLRALFYSKKINPTKYTNYFVSIVYKSCASQFSYVTVFLNKSIETAR